MLAVEFIIGILYYICVEKKRKRKLSRYNCCVQWVNALRFCRVLELKCISKIYVITVCIKMFQKCNSWAFLGYLGYFMLLFFFKSITGFNVLILRMNVFEWIVVILLQIFVFVPTHFKCTKIRESDVIFFSSS